MESAVSAHGTKYASKVAVLSFLVSSIFGFLCCPHHSAFQFYKWPPFFWISMKHVSVLYTWRTRAYLCVCTYLEIIFLNMHLAFSKPFLSNSCLVKRFLLSHTYDCNQPIVKGREKKKYVFSQGKLWDTIYSTNILQVTT